MQRNIYQQPTPRRNVRWSSWVMFVVSIAAFVFVTISVYDLGSAYITNQRLKSEQARLEDEIERIRELFTTEDGKTMFDLYLKDNNSVFIVIPLG